jgi:hypothetical protein
MSVDRRQSGFATEVAHFPMHHGISLDQAGSLIEKYGNDRQTLLREVARLKN